MRNSFDWTPYRRSTVGFDRLFDFLESSGSADNYPPFDIEKVADDHFRITIAVAGFGEGDLSIESKENALTVKGEKQLVEGAEKREVLHQGIAARAFERRFQLADYVQVTGASLENGLLHIDLVREIPEAKKPRQIAIGTGGSAKVLEAKVAKAA